MTSLHQVPEVDRHFGPMGPTRWEAVKMVRMPHLLAIMVDLSSESCQAIVRCYAHENDTSLRTQIDLMISSYGLLTIFTPSHRVGPIGPK